MTAWCLALAAPDQGFTPDIGAGVRGLAAVFVVLALLALFAWLLRKGAFGALGRRAASPITIETAVPLGERRSVVIVAVEGRRLLLGLAPGQVSMLTELAARPATFASTLDQAAGQPPQAAL
jgi:flagellar biosynthetic protein FliO